MRDNIKALVDSTRFEYFIVAVILINAVILGMETSPTLLERYGDWLYLGNDLVLVIFIVEAALKMYAVAPRIQDYFKSGWNVFDFSVIVLSLIPATGELAMIARTARLLRVLRLISTIPELRLIVATLVRSIPSMGNILILMGIIFYIYAILGFHLFHVHDPVHWRNLGIALITLFRIVTLEDWTDVMYKAMELHEHAWLFFVSFVVIATFVVVNLFIAIVINNLEEAKQERLRELERIPDHDELLEELKNTKLLLDKLEKRLRRETG